MKNHKLKYEDQNSFSCIGFQSILKSLAFISFFISCLLLLGCQDEINEFVEGDGEEEVFVATSYVASLMKSTVTKDGSEDNILDNASCFSVKLPVNVHINGLEIIVDSTDDFDTIEEIFDEYYDDEDHLEYEYPITIILSDYSEVEIENADQLEIYIGECEEEDDDIECVDFNYPMSYSVFNKELNKVRTVVIESDRDMYRFIKNINRNDIVSIQFPITLEFSGGDEIVVEDMTGLESALESGIEFCDEDDDNDYDDDDFDLERLNNLLVKCPWIVHDVLRENTSLTADYREYLIVFKENGVVKVRRRNGEVVLGSWETKMTDRGVVIELAFENELIDFTLVWKVADINHDRIKLYSGTQGRIVLEKKCDLVFDYNIERVKNILSECLWRVHRLHIQGITKEEEFIGTPIKFFENGVAKLRINGEFVQGEWDVTESINGSLILHLGFDNYPDLNLQWKIKLLENKKLILVNENSEMLLIRECPNDDGDIVYVNNIITTGKWMVAKYENEDGITDDFNDYIIDFKESGRILAENDTSEFKGSWISYRYDGKLKLGLNFWRQEPLNEFNYRWKILKINEGRIELVDFAANGSRERTLVLEKITL